VRLTAYGGGAADLPGDVLQAFINSAEAGHAYVPIDKVFNLDQIAEAHAYMVS
jgi:NADPH2:quinone reductase